jgi:hypothetical protein
MGFWDDVKEDFKGGAKGVWEDIKTGLKDEARRAWNVAKKQAERDLRAVPESLQRILDSTPPDTTPEIPYSLEGVELYLDRLPSEEDFARGAIDGTIRGRRVRFTLTEEDRQVSLAAEWYLRRVREQQGKAKVPKWLQVVLAATPNDVEPTVKYRQDIKIFIDPFQDFDEASKRGFAYATVKSRRIRVDMREL